SECQAEAQAQRRSSQGAEVGSGGDALVAESVSQIASSVGEEKGELSGDALLCLRHYLLEKM
ncbi:MAG: hypothetical protein V7641_1403, partial [Blastocatellia bacterium]